MPLTLEQAKQIKEQLLKQISNLPPEQQEQAKQQIIAFSNKQLEQLLIKNQQATQNQKLPQDCIFCSIIEGKTPSYKIDENKKSLAILEINPLSKGHALVISKEHDKLPSPAFTLANKIAKKIKSKFKPKQVKISSTEIFGHKIVEILPLYGNEKERKKATEEELKKLQEQLKVKPRKPAKSKIKKPKSLPKLKPRIP